MNALRAQEVTPSIIRAMIDDAANHGYAPSDDRPSAVLGIFGDPVSAPTEGFEHRGISVQVAAGVSSLAAWAQILDHEQGWLVIITDRPEGDLGAGILAHFVGNKLRTPNPWEAVRKNFGATGLQPALFSVPKASELAVGLLSAQPEAGWPPAPAGALTQAHALGSVAREHLSWTSSGVDIVSLLRWTTRPDLPTQIATLRDLAGGVLVESVLAWLAAATGSPAPAIETILRGGTPVEALPLGLAAITLHSATGSDPAAARPALTALAGSWDAHQLTPQALETWGHGATTVIGELLADAPDLAARLLTRSEEHLRSVDAAHLAASSAVLPAGLASRARAVAEALPGADHSTSGDYEAAFAHLTEHALFRADDLDIRALNAGVRLARWLRARSLADPLPETNRPEALAELTVLHQREITWVDRAVNDAAAASEPVGAALGALLGRVREHRAAFDATFGAALAQATADERGTRTGHLESDDERVWYLEHLIAQVVAPIAKATPTLLLVLDGMSTAVAAEVLDDIRDRRPQWTETLPEHVTHRASAIAVLPTLTNVSRTSLFSGKVTRGGQDAEQAGFAGLTRAHGLRGELFHKKILDTTQPGFAVSSEVSSAISHTGAEFIDRSTTADRTDLVACVLNTIDDALDSADPAGTTWTADTVRHLLPLLDQAVASNRTVVITADHGHIVERRTSALKRQQAPTSARSRDTSAPAEDGEVLVRGSRVDGGEAVLAVDELLRYTDLKAGYHGGASPAEVVVPVAILSPADPVAPLREAPTQTPTWWNSAVSAEATAPSAWGELGADEGTLFAEPSTTPMQQVISSDTYRQMRDLNPRNTLTDEQVLNVLDALAGATAHRLPGETIAALLEVSSSRIRGAISHLQGLLNVEGYPVISDDGGTVVLDLALLHEQFGIDR